jgi:hypothetical protein
MAQLYIQNGSIKPFASKPRGFSTMHPLTRLISSTCLNHLDHEPLWKLISLTLDSTDEKKINNKISIKHLLALLPACAKHPCGF